MQIDELLKLMVEKNASDLHIRVGSPPMFRIYGKLSPVKDWLPVTVEDSVAILESISSPTQRQTFAETLELDLAYSSSGIGRFRVNVLRQRGTVAFVIRLVAFKIPTIEQLGLPLICKELILRPRGLILVTGPAGSGKSTTMAAMIDHLNETESRNIITIEDPIEYLHHNKKSIIAQRDLGDDTHSFDVALMHTLRQDPDVIYIGEMRDLPTISTAIRAAETGHLVLGTLHTTDAVQTINRIIDLYPPHQQQQVRYQLADTLKGVVCMRLISHAKGIGRVPACEILVVTALVRKAISDNKMADVQEAIRQGQYYGMQTFHQALLKLYKDGVVKLDDALEAASNPEELMMAIRGITSGADTAA